MSAPTAEFLMALEMIRDLQKRYLSMKTNAAELQLHSETRETLAQIERRISACLAETRDAAAGSRELSEQRIRRVEQSLRKFLEDAVGEKMAEAVETLTKSAADVELAEMYDGYYDHVGTLDARIDELVERDKQRTDAMDELFVQNNDSLEKLKAELKAGMDGQLFGLRQQATAMASEMERQRLENNNDLKILKAEFKANLDEQLSKLRQQATTTATQVMASGMEKYKTENNNSLEKLKAELKASMDEQLFNLRQQETQAMASEMEKQKAESKDSLKKFKAELKASMDEQLSMLRQRATQAMVSEMEKQRAENMDSLENFKTEFKASMDEQLFKLRQQATTTATQAMASEMEKHKAELSAANMDTINAAKTLQASTAQSVADIRTKVVQANESLVKDVADALETNKPELPRKMRTQHLKDLKTAAEQHLAELSQKAALAAKTVDDAVKTHKQDLATVAKGSSGGGGAGRQRPQIQKENTVDNAQLRERVQQLELKADNQARDLASTIEAMENLAKTQARSLESG